MPDFLSAIPNTHIKVPRGFVDTLIQTQREKLFTGLMHLHDLSSSSMVLSFLQGVQQKLYISRDQNMVDVSLQSWSDYLDHSDVSIGFLELSVDALRIARVIYESPVIATEHVSFSPESLFDSVAKWGVEPFPSTIIVKGESATRLYLIAGFSIPVIEQLSIVGDQARFAITDASFAKSLLQGSYQVARYVGDGKGDVWQEYELRFAFNSLMYMLITRFSELAGRVLADRLCMQLSTSISDGCWKISVTTNGLSNHHYFESLVEEKRAYLEILKSFHRLASPAIGSRLVNTFAHQSLLKLNPHHQTLLQRHIYDSYDFENAAPSGGLSS